MSPEENKALVRRFFEAQSRGDLDTIEQLLAPNFVDRSVLRGQEPDREGYKREVIKDWSAFSDLRYVIEDQLADGDKVVSRLTIRGTRDPGVYEGVAPAMMEMVFTGIVIDRIVGGKIVEEWSESGGPLLLTEKRLEQERLERERVEQELRVAQHIQHASLPKSVPALEGWEIASHYQPAREVGGDFYDFHVLSGGRIGLAVGDATGHGIPAALVMATTCGMLRAVSQASGSSPPGEVLARVNEALYPNIPPNMFVTCFYAILDPESGYLRYANAGHNLPCCRRRQGLATELRARGMPLGLMPGMSYEERETSLLSGDSILFYSDGLVEAHNPHFEMFGTPRLRNLLTEHPADVQNLTAILLEELERFTGEGWEQEDDITLLALRNFASQASG